MDGLEIELKAGLDAASARLLARRLTGCAGPPGSVALIATFYDTEDRRLQRAGIALRVRREGRVFIQTVKSGRTGEGGFQQVRETERRLPNSRPDLRKPGDPQLARTLAGLLGGVEPEAWITTRVRRRLWRVRHPIGLVEVAIDVGRIEADGRTAPVLEAEFELKEGSPEAVFAIAADLVGDLPVDLLLPSKAARGARLAEGSAAPPVQRRPRPHDAQIDAAVAWRAALGGLAATIAAELRRVLIAGDPEGPHQLRVALRRLRVLAGAYRPILEAGVAAEIAEEARRIGRLVAPLRDSDVMIDMIETAGRADPILENALAAQRSRVRAEVRSKLREGRATGFAIRLLQLANLGGWRPDGRSGPVRAADLLDRRLKRQWKAARQLGDRLSTLDDEQRHEFRKLIKNIRYLLEFHETKRVSREIRTGLKKLQENLGSLNDLHMLARWELNGVPPVAEAALFDARGALLHAAASKADLALGRACRHWRALSGLEQPAALPAPQQRPAPNR